MPHRAARPGPRSKLPADPCAPPTCRGRGPPARAAASRVEAAGGRADLLRGKRAADRRLKIRPARKAPEAIALGPRDGSSPIGAPEAARAVAKPHRRLELAGRLGRYSANATKLVNADQVRPGISAQLGGNGSCGAAQAPRFAQSRRCSPCAGGAIVIGRRFPGDLAAPRG